MDGHFPSRFTFAIGQGLIYGLPIQFVGSVPIPSTFETPGTKEVIEWS